MENISKFIVDHIFSICRSDEVSYFLYICFRFHELDLFLRYR